MSPEEVYRANLNHIVDELTDLEWTKADLARACFPKMAETAAAVRRLDRELGTASGPPSQGVKWETLAGIARGLELESLAELFKP